MLSIIKADGKQEKEALALLKSRGTEVDRQVTAVVNEIIETVREKGDEALAMYARKFDGAAPPSLEVPKEEIQEALDKADKDYAAALENARKNIEAFHTRQKQQSFLDAQPNGVILGQRVRGLAKVGLYVPGGTAAYPSSVLMNAVPAKIAEVGELIMVTPPGKDGRANRDILAAAAVAGVDRVFLTGGAQAVAALAYGTETIPQVDKIVGPGNIYVATAKKLLYGQVDIDMIAGPSEILVVADETADPKYLAADLMSQAEHDKLASSILLCTDQTVARKTIGEIMRQVEGLSRKEIILESLENFGAVILCKDFGQMVELANQIAPEHLEVMTGDPLGAIGCFDNAGSVFLGRYSPEPLGDYYAGPNHVLPTSGTARFFSPLSVESFLKRSGFIYYTEEALKNAAADILAIARKEGLDAHANAITVRF